MAIVRYTADEAKKLKGDTDIDRFNSLTDKQIEEAARNDPDSAVPTPEQLKQFTRRKADGKKDSQQRTSKNLVGATDWNRVKALTDRQIEEASRTDRCAKILEPHELPQFKRKRIVETKP